MNMLHMSSEDMSLFWQLIHADPIELQSIVGISIPKRVWKVSLNDGSFAMDSIEKCLWILREQFHFGTTGQLRLHQVTSVKRAFDMLQHM